MPLKMIKTLIVSFGKYTKFLILSCLFVTLEVLFDILLPRYMGKLIDFGIESGSIANTVRYGLILVAFAAAATDYAKNLEARHQRIAEIRSFIIDRLGKESFVHFNQPQNSCDGILNLSLLGQKSETVLNALSMKGIYVSASSACSSKKAENRVLKAFGLTKELMDGALRIGISYTNSLEEADSLCNELLSFCERKIKK